jgi:hypothetical protein
MATSEKVRGRGARRFSINGAAGHCVAPPRVYNLAERSFPGAEIFVL